MADLLVAGGRVVTAQRSFGADVAITDGRIDEVGPDLARRHPDAKRIDADGLLVLPGCVDVHTHTRLPTDDEPDRFYQDSVAAAFGGTTTFLAFNNPGTGISEGGSLPCWPAWRSSERGPRGSQPSTSPCRPSCQASRRTRSRSCPR